MSVWFGAGVLVVVVGLVLLLASMKWDVLLGPSLVVTLAPFVLGLAALGVHLISGGEIGPSVVEGRCYRAVGHGSVTLIPAGKVLVSTYRRSIDMLEIDCP